MTSDARGKRVSREIALAAVGMTPDRFDAWVLDRLTDLLDERDVRAGEALWRAGDHVEWLYFMVEGCVRATREGSPPWTFKGRWLLGGFEGHLNRPSTRTFAATADFHGFRIQRRAWLELLEDNFELTRRSVLRSAETVASLDERLPIVEGPPLLSSLAVPSMPKRRLSLVERLAFLTELPMARDAGVQVLAEIAAIAQEVSIPAQAVVFHVGALDERLLFVAEGEVEAERHAPDLVRRFGPGETVTGPAAFTAGPRRWTVRAKKDTRLLAVSTEAWFDVMEEHFDLAHSTLSVLAGQREVLLETLANAAGPDGIVLV